MILTTAVAVVVVAGGYWMLGGPEGKVRSISQRKP